MLLKTYLKLGGMGILWLQFLAWLMPGLMEYGDAIPIFHQTSLSNAQFSLSKSSIRWIRVRLRLLQVGLPR
jgi:hypothetical protein